MLSSVVTDTFTGPFRRYRSGVDPFARTVTECPWDDDEDTVIELVPAGAVVARDLDPEILDPEITLPPVDWELLRRVVPRGSSRGGK